MIIEGDAATVVVAAGGEIVALDCDSPNATVSRESDERSSVGIGMTNRAPHCGQTPRFPARNVFTLSLCPFGHENRIPISRPSTAIRDMPDASAKIVPAARRAIGARDAFSSCHYT